MTVLPINTPEYIRDLATRVDEFDRMALRLLADQIDELEAAHQKSAQPGSRVTSHDRGAT